MRTSLIVLASVAALVAVPLAAATADPCHYLVPLPCPGTSQEFLKSTCATGAGVHDYARATAKVLLVATGLGCHD